MITKMECAKCGTALSVPGPLMCACGSTDFVATVVSGDDPEPRPIDMVLHCPKCGMQHIDAPEKCAACGDTGLAVGGLEACPVCVGVSWTNPPHRSHRCHNVRCGHVWRPADVPTNGVAAVKTCGKADSPVVTTGLGSAYDLVSILRNDLAVAAATLRQYEAYHDAKGTPESSAKASVNRKLASRFEATLALATMARGEG